MKNGILKHHGIEYKVGRFGRIMVRYTPGDEWMSSTTTPGEFAHMVQQEERKAKQRAITGSMYS